jgi:serine/threonine-protein kinase
LKPANVLITKSGQYKITDFGLAKRLGDSLGFTRTGDIMGTPGYMAPEQAAGKTGELNSAVDVYALGAILYELLTGRPPFRGVNVADTLEMVRNEEPAAPSRLVPRLHRDLSTICLKCLHKSPARRYESAEALAIDLRRWLDGDPIQARPPRSIERAWRAVKRRPITAGLVLSAATSVMALSLYAIAVTRAREAEDRQAREEALRMGVQRQFTDSLKAFDAICGLVQAGSALQGPNGLKPLHEKLQDYYRSLIANEQAMAWSDPLQIADACLNLGDLLSRTGKKQDAIDAYRQAGVIFEKLTSRERGSETARRKLARTFLECGKQCRDLGRLDDAAQRYQAARSLLEALVAQSPNDPEDRRLLAETWHQTGVLLADDAATRLDALAAYERGRQLRRELLDEKPTSDIYRRDLARSYGYAGDVELDLGQLPEADRSYWESHRLREPLNRDAEDRMQLARSWSNFGLFQVRGRAYSTAIEFFEKSRKIQRELVDQAPAFTEYRSDLAGTLCRIGELKIMQRLPAPELDDARAIYAELLAIDPASQGFKAGVVESQTLLAIAAVDNRAKARGYLDIARGLADELMKSRKSANDAYWFAVIAALDDRADQRDKAGDWLKIAIERGFRRKHPDDVRSDRGFGAVRTSRRFQDAIELYEEKLRGDRPAVR